MRVGQRRGETTAAKLGRRLTNGSEDLMDTSRPFPDGEGGSAVDGIRFNARGIMVVDVWVAFVMRNQPMHVLIRGDFVPHSLPKPPPWLCCEW